MPIGSNAVYVWGNVGIDDGFFAVENAMVIMSPSSPSRPLHNVNHWWGIGCSEGSPSTNVPIPDGYVVGNAGSGGDGTLPNRPGGVLRANGTDILEFQYAMRCNGTGPLVAGAVRCTHSIYGSGLCSYGAQGGSGLSGVGGVLRNHELTGIIPHALKVTLPVEELSNCNGGYRWPAVAADGYHNDAYSGSVCALRMGSLVALNPSYNCGVHAGLAVRICQALKDYGGYVGDTHNGWSPGTIIGEYGASTSALSGVGGQIVTMLRNLYAIDNNTSTNIGGGGTPRVPLAPAIGN